MRHFALLCAVVLLTFAAMSIEARRRRKSKDYPCTELHGYCQHDKRRCPGGYYETDLCGGGRRRRCCMPEDPKCDAVSGECMWKTHFHCWGGRYKKRLCNGPGSRQCCVPRDK